MREETAASGARVLRAAPHPGRPADHGEAVEAGIDRLAALFEAGPVALLTGAGVSTDSGIPDYRGEGSPPRTPMSIAQFMQDEDYRRRFWAGARIGSVRASGVEPNAGHFAAARLELAGFLNGIVTQNVDDLHSRAGSRTVVELHGNGGTIRCVDCDRRWSRAEVLGWFDDLNPGFAARHADAEVAPDGDAIVTEISGVRVPRCPACGGLLRPDVVYFGEFVPSSVFSTAADLVAGAGALVIAGSSLAVNTGMRLVHRAERRGIPIAVINRGPTAADRRAALRLDAGTSETLAALADRLGAGV
ncbi:NAD-dependent deacetylase [Leucobacter sp. CSA1]|uniref:protein acetyllysine N-acetyltransferase n=1 Tax=Leucobacter chromiisoli TaxID=2796471 RepID=A0A934Q983_9MICO|nr:Sir2 family NAD-dependent protein deacetylase [Leucobacter chromiisoli]MBK0418882.1 NAD-dependent deacetylase [Leucobacter chromiisoli]